MRGAGPVFLEFLLGREDGGDGGLVFRPVDLAGFEIVEVDLVNRRGLAVEGVFRVVAPVVGGGDDVAAFFALGLGLGAASGKDAFEGTHEVWGG